MTGTDKSPVALAPAPMDRSFLRALFVLLAFTLLVIVDQSFWWRTNEDFSFGWLTPAFVAFVIYDRWPAIRRRLAECANPAAPRLGRAASLLLHTLAILALLVGLSLFVLGSAYRSGAGTTYPGSLALSLGLALCAFPLIVLFAPEAQGPTTANPANDSRLRLAALFVFPALVWLLSAPNISKIDAWLTGLLLQKVITVVSFVFNAFGFPIERQGTVLVLPDASRVGVEDACSGIRSLKACLFAGSFLGAVMLDRFWKKVTLVVASMIFAFAMNLVRGIFLTAWAYRNGAASIEGRVHDTAGYAILGVTVVGLLCLVPILGGSVFGGAPGKAKATADSEEIE
jgi:exosortase/archaeosortase family protein